MKPKIVTRLANIFAKLAGSADYDPTVEPKTPLEYYANQLPVVPNPTNNDSGKYLLAVGKDEYTLAAPPAFEVTAEDVVSATGQMDALQKRNTRANIKAEIEKLYIFAELDGNNVICDTTFSEIEDAFDAERIVYLQLVNGDNDELYTLQNYTEDGEFIFICQTQTTTNARIMCYLNGDNTVWHYNSVNLVATIEYVKVIFSYGPGSTPKCSANFADISGIGKIQNCRFYYSDSGTGVVYSLPFVYHKASTTLTAATYFPDDPTDPTSGYTHVICTLSANNTVTIQINLL